MAGRSMSERSPLRGGPTFPLSQRIQRGAWLVVWNTFGYWTPSFMCRWRILLLRCFGAKVDWTAKVYPKVSIWWARNLRMGPYACLGPGVHCYCMDIIELEAFALVSQRATLCAGGHDIDSGEFDLVTAPIRLEQGCWVAAEAFVGPGVTIGERAVLGARGVTFRDVPPNAVLVGNPARFLRSRTGSNPRPEA